MYRYCLTITSLFINLPPQSCKLRFIVRSCLEIPKCTEQISLKKKQTRLFLNQDIVFTVTDDNKQAVSVYIIAVTSEMIIHLGMFILNLSQCNQDQQQTSELQGCIGQHGSIVYRLDSIKHSYNQSSINLNVQAKSQSKEYNAENSVNASKNYNEQMSQQLQILKLQTIKKDEQLKSLQSICDQLKKQNTNVKKQAKQYQSLSKKLAQKYEQVISQNINLKSKYIETNSQKSSVLSFKLQTKNKQCQTVNIIQQSNQQIQTSMVQNKLVINNIISNTSSYCQTETIEQSNSQNSLIKTISLNHKISLLEKLMKIQQMEIEQLRYQLENKKTVNDLERTSECKEEYKEEYSSQQSQNQQKQLQQGSGQQFNTSKQSSYME